MNRKILFGFGIPPLHHRINAFGHENLKSWLFMGWFKSVLGIYF